MVQNNIYEIAKFCECFHKNNGIFTYSGEMALEVALNAINIKNKKVVIPNNVCHRILISILQSGGIPVIVNPQNGFVINKTDIENVMKVHFDIVAIIIVHQYGIRANIKEIKDILNDNIKIIEDIAQGWKIQDIGYYSDFVITSFGKSKQLSFGIGGGVFSNNETINQVVDLWHNTSRQSKNIPLPYMLPNNIKINFNKLKNMGNKNIKKQVNIATKVQRIMLKKYNTFNCMNIDKGVWNRYPIWTKSLIDYQNMIQILNKFKIKFELPHKKTLEEIPFLKNYNCFVENYNNNKNFIILIKTRNNTNWRLLRWKIIG